MKNKGMIIVSEKKELFKYNTRDQKLGWQTKFEKKIAGISRIEDYVFVVTTSWGSLYTSLIDYETGTIKWTIDKVLYNVHILDESILFLDTTKEIVSISLQTGNENFRIKTGFRWTTPKMVLLDNKIYMFSKKKTVFLNLKTGALAETKLPSKLDSKKIKFIIDEFQMNVNLLNSSDTGFFPIHDGGTSLDGGDIGVGDAGGIDGSGGGGE